MTTNRFRALAAAAILALLAALAPKARAETAKLKFGYPTVMRGGVSDVLRGWAKEVDRDSGGRLSIEFLPGGSVVTFNNVLDGVLNKVVDIGFGLFGNYAAQFHSTDIASLPFECTNSRDCSIVMWRLYASGLTAPEFAKVKVLALFTFPRAVLNTDKLVKTANDMKSMKILVIGRTMAKAAALLGAVPLTISPRDFYGALQRGVADGAVISWNAIFHFKLQDVTKYHLGVPLGLFPAFIFMNKASYAELSARNKAVIDKVSGEKFSSALGGVSDKTAEDAISELEAMPGQTVTPDLSPEQAARWKHLLAPISEKWVSSTPNGAKLLSAFRVEMAKVTARK